MLVIKLLPCPCCGGEAKASSKRGAIDCTRCGMTTGARYDLEHAAKLWNKRVNVGKGAQRLCAPAADEQLSEVSS
jgi:hypothetical protein